MIHERDGVDAALRMQAIQLEDEYFTDLTLRDYPGITEILDYAGDFGSIPSIEHVALFSIEALDGNTAGRFDRQTKAITLAPDDDGQVLLPDLLHEMIHFYEFELEGDRKDEHGNPQPDQSLKQYLTAKLWLKVSESIPDLDQRAQKFLEMTSHNDLEHEGGEHDLLFFLKSLELDVKSGYPLGTVLGYGYDTELESE